MNSNRISLGAFRLLLATVLVAVTAPLQPTVLAGTVNWTGADDGTSWNQPLNWDTGALPGSGDDVVIDVPGDVTVVLTATASIRSLTCQEALQLSGTLTLNGGASTINGALTLYGTLSAKPGATFSAPNLTALVVP